MRWPWKKQTGAAQPMAARDVPKATEPISMVEAEPSVTEPLTPRERDVFDLLIRGKKLKEIAEELGIRYSTVNTHQKSVYKKLGVNSRAECILRFGKPGEE